MNIFCIIMASGEARRFGSNKLLAQFCGESVIACMLGKIKYLVEKGHLMSGVCVTRYDEIENSCREYGIEYVMHAMPDRNDTIRLGIEYIDNKYKNMLPDGVMFVNADQPLLSVETMVSLLEGFKDNRDKICRLSYGDVPGNPVIFPWDLHRELRELPAKKGGGYLIKKYSEQVVYVPARNMYELMDIDTPQNLDELAAYASSLSSP